MLSDPSTLLLLKYGIPCLPQKMWEITSTGQFRSQIGTWSGKGGLHMLVLLKLLMLMFYFFDAFN